jgi:hypothetical protein
MEPQEFEDFVEDLRRATIPTPPPDPELIDLTDEFFDQDDELHIPGPPRLPADLL